MTQIFNANLMQLVDTITRERVIAILVVKMGKVAKKYVIAIIFTSLR